MNLSTTGPAMSPSRRRSATSTFTAAACTMFFAISLALVVPVGAAAQAAPAQSDDVGASERVNYSGKLRMLSQRIAAAACNKHADINGKQASALLLASTAEFTQILDGLQYGSQDLKMIGEETDRKVLRSIGQIRDLWGPLHDRVRSMDDAATSSDEMVVDIANESAPLLEAAKLLVTEVSGEYSDPTALVQADALAIDIAGRQRMLAQRISKNACLVASGLLPEAAAELAGAVKIYQASANALRNGMSSAGIQAPPTEEIAIGLQGVLDGWASVQPLLSALQDGAEVSRDDRAEIFEQMNNLTAQMNTIVGQYSAASAQSF